MRKCQRNERKRRNEPEEREKDERGDDREHRCTELTILKAMGP
jgi:hypothetical protein